MQIALGVSISAYLLATLGLAWRVRGRIHDEEDYIVAGRRLPLPLATATLLATWFGAGTLLTATDEIRAEGLRVAALEPYGAGMCLLLAGVFFAKPLWEMKLCTLSDMYRRKFGPRAEVLSVWVTVPGYIGWVAVQLVALAGILDLFFGLPQNVGIVAIAAFATAYTLLGGMWSVTVTDSLQMAFIIPGVLLLGWEVFREFGDGGVAAGLARLAAESDPGMLTLVPRESLREFSAWVGVLAVSALGNLPGQDLAQRIFAADSARTAKRACLAAGAIYLTLGTVPALLGLVARLLLPPEIQHSVLPALAARFLSPSLTVLFALALLSVVLSTIDSAILAPATTLARNAWRDWPKGVDPLRRNQACVVLVAAASVAVALVGENAYGILEESYALGLVGLFVPFFIAATGRVCQEAAAVRAMVAGMTVWAAQFLHPTAWPVDLAAVGAAFAVYYLSLKRAAPSAR